MTILQTTTVAIPIFGLVFATLICFIVAFTIVASGTNSSAAVRASIISSIVGLICGVLTLVTLEETTRYQVLLDDIYPVSELYENYEIVEQEGITYWIEEKDNED